MRATRLKGATRSFLIDCRGHLSSAKPRPQQLPLSQLQMEFVFHHQPLIAQHHHGAASRQAR